MGKTAPALPVESRTIYNLLVRSAETWGTRPALHQPSGGGQYKSWNWIEYRTAAEEIAVGLHELGVRQGDIVGLASETRAEFYLADIAVMVNGSIAAAVYTSLAPAQQVGTLQACDPKAVFFESSKTMAALDAAGASSLGVPRILLTGSAPGAITLDELRRSGRDAMAADPGLLPRITSAVKPDHLAILYLTSGATGEPKMGLVTHNSLVFNVDLAPAVIDLNDDDSTLAFLPSAHITQRLVMEIMMMRMGVPVYFSEGLSKMPTELRTVRPTFFIAPPRVWERIYTSITTEIKKKPALIRKMFYMGLGVGNEAVRARQEGRAPNAFVQSSLKLFDKVIFQKVRERMGGRIRIAVSGSAPLGRDLAEFFSSIGLNLVEGYGLTEGGVTALNPLQRPVPGSIGRVIPGAQMKIADDGELLIGGETVFAGYYKDHEATAAVLRDGWLHTGDIAQVDHDGYYYITGRKKELIVASNGKKIYPSRIETLFKLEPLVNHVLLVGDRLPYMGALVTLNPQAAETVPGLEGLNQKSLPALAKSEAIQAEMKRIVQRVNRQLASFEQIRKFKILDRDFSMEAGELTPTMKLRRGRVLENFKNEIAELYAGREEYA